jgi:hypothetical protein
MRFREQVSVAKLLKSPHDLHEASGTKGKEWLVDYFALEF